MCIRDRYISVQSNQILSFGSAHHRKIRKLFYMAKAVNLVRTEASCFEIDVYKRQVLTRWYAAKSSTCFWSSFRTRTREFYCHPTLSLT